MSRLNGLKRFALAGLVLAVVGACTPGTQDELARGAARAVVKPVLAERLPGVPIDGAVDCVIDNATSQEILVLAADAVTGPTENTTQMVAQVLRRPATQTCLVQSYSQSLLGGLAL